MFAPNLSGIFIQIYPQNLAPTPIVHTRDMLLFLFSLRKSWQVHMLCNNNLTVDCVKSKLFVRYDYGYKFNCWCSGPDLDSQGPKWLPK